MTTSTAAASRPPLQVAFLTGQSRPPSAALTPGQTAFLASLPLPVGCLRIGRNFPYPVVSGEEDRHALTPLLLASWRNGAQYLFSRRRRWGQRHRPSVETLLAAADHTLFLAGSCGLELFNNLGLPADARSQTSLFAYGPVARRRPAGCASCFLVQGNRDLMSRWYFPTVDARVDASHMDYLTNPAVQALAVAMVRQLTPAPLRP